MSGNASTGFASAVSRALRKQGIRPLPSGTAPLASGIRVIRGTQQTARVWADFDVDSIARRRMDVVVQALHEAGYRTTRTTDSWLTVHRGGTSNSSTDEREQDR